LCKVTRSRLLFFLGCGFATLLRAHAPPVYLPKPPLRVDGNLLRDSDGQRFLLTGVNMPGLESFTPAKVDLDAQQAMTSFTFRVIQQRWNMNAVRLPVSPWIWKRDGQRYLDRVKAAAAAANQEGLVVILAAEEDARSGAPDDIGLPSAILPDFWKACASAFKDAPLMVFSLYHEPSTRNIAGAVPTVRRASEWQVWLKGGALTQGRSTVGMQALVDAIRGVGATQIIAASSFHDTQDFQGFGPDAYLRDANILYEVHPFYDHGVTDGARNANFGFMAATFPVIAGEWGMPFGQMSAACRAIPGSVDQATNLLYQTLAYFNLRDISWAATDFGPASLIQNFTDDSPTDLIGGWTCDGVVNPRIGIGRVILLWVTGDPNGFGSLDVNLIASAATLYVGPPAPGELMSIYGQLVGPADPVGARLDENGRVTTTLGDTQVFFDGIAAPMLLAGYYQTNVQVPYEIAGKKSTVVQLVYRGVPSNKLELPVLDVSPGFLWHTAVSQAAAINEDGSINGSSHAAPRGSIVSLFATGLGQTAPPSVTGVLATQADPLALKATVTIGNRSAEVLFAGAAPGLVGVSQINARVPADVPLETQPVQAGVVVTVGGTASIPGITIWVK
jgi:uncharacterized protein (TIGR03437 family)